jgi:hypothetical protein
MQYIMSETEYDYYLKKEAIANKSPDKTALQDLCTKAADSIPLTSGWMQGKPWGCILTRGDNWYCDECPALKVCPHPHKHYSK